MSHKKFTLAQLSEYLSAKIQGDPNIEVTALVPLQNASTGQISFLDNPKYRKFLTETKASAVILSKEMAEKCPCAALIVDNPYLAYAMTATLFDDKPITKSGIHPTAIIGEYCEIDHSVTIGPNVVIGDYVKIGKNTVIQPGCVINHDVEIGSDCWLWPNITVYHGTRIGARVIIHSNSVIGADGFGFAFHQGKYHKIPQIGIVRIGDDVEIGASTSIDRGALADTVIGNGVKLDNQIQIGHNVEIGDHTVIAAGTGVAGSTKIGKYCRVGGLVGFAGHITIADQVTVTAMASVAQSIDEPGVYSSGVPVTPFSIWKRNMIRFQQLDNIARRLMQLERKLGEQEEENV